ncbi:MAG TPA: phosphatidate cytidylyltransferase [Puia sp.]|nr:phosphatidate cytidylyltransferase [Puia sp.]
MALNIVSFRTRALTALIFVAVMLAGLLWNEWSFLVLFSVVHFGCWFEYQKLIALIDPRYKQISVFHKYGVMLAGWSLMLYASGEAFHIGHVSLQTIGFWAGLMLIFVLPILEILFAGTLNFKNIAHSFLGLLYISLTLALFTNLRVIFYNSKLNLILVLMVIASLWINDTMAYLVGSWIGKTPLSKISPRKTWEGTLGGIILAVVVMGLIGYFVSSEFDWEAIIQWMSVAAITAVMGTFGDLLESKLKRMAQVKDSGHVLPGHGGFLDRFDSLLIAVPFVWIYVMLFMRP